MVDVTATSYFSGTTKCQFALTSMQNSAALTADCKASGTALIAKYKVAVRSLARKYSNGENTEDLTQEGLIALLDAARTWREESQFWTYARSVVRTAMIRYATKDAAAETAYGDLVSDIESEAPSPEELFELAEGVSRISTSMVHLSESERRVLRLRFIEEQDIRTIGESVGVSKSEADRIYRGALEKLRELISARAS